MTSEEIFAYALKAGLIDKSESGDWFVRPDAEVKEVFKFANLISVVEGLVDSEADEILVVIRKKERDMNHKEIERLRDLSFHRLNKINSLRVNNQMREKIQALKEAENDNEIRRLREAVAAEREACAKVCEDTALLPDAGPLYCAAAIRARGQ